MQVQEQQFHLTLSVDSCVAAVAPFLAFVLHVALPDFYVRSAASQVTAPSLKRARIHSVCRPRFVQPSASASHLASLCPLDPLVSVLLETLQVTFQLFALDSFASNAMLQCLYVIAQCLHRHFALQLQRNSCVPSLTHSISLCHHQRFWAKFVLQYCVQPFSCLLLRHFAYNLTLFLQRHLQPSLSNAFEHAHPLHSPSQALLSRLPAHHWIPLPSFPVVVSAASAAFCLAFLQQWLPSQLC